MYERTNTALLNREVVQLLKCAQELGHQSKLLTMLQDPKTFTLDENSRARLHIKVAGELEKYLEEDSQDKVADDQEKKEEFDINIYAERASHRHQKISDADFEALKSLSARYSYTMRGEVKMHRFDDKSFYIPDYNKVDLRYSDMCYQENGKKDNSKKVFDNLKYSPKMQKLAKENGLDLSTINFQESLDTFLYLGQAVADVYSMGITFDVYFIKNNQEAVKRILYGIYTITGQIIIMPYEINKEGNVSFSGIITDDACLFYGFWSGNDDLSSFIACRS